MNKLIKVFLVPFIKLWFFYMSIHIILAVFVAAFGKSAISKDLTGILSFAFFGFLIISPIYLNAKTNTFVKNISWMINSARNRTQLVIYYHLELLFRILLTLAPFALYYFLWMIKNNSSDTSLIESENYLLLFLGTWAIANFAGLSMSSLVKTSQVRKARAKSTKRFLISIFLCFVVLNIGAVIVSSPILIEGILIIASFLFLVYVYSTHFVLFRPKTRNAISIVGAIILVFPTVFSVSNSLKNLSNPDIAFHHYVQLGSLVNDFDIDSRGEIFKSLQSKEDIREFLLITENVQNLDLIGKLDNKLDDSTVVTIVSHIQKYLDEEGMESLLIEIESLSESKINKIIKRRALRGVASRAKVDKNEIAQKLIETESRLRQALALELIASKRSKNEFNSFIDQHKSRLSEEQIQRFR